MSDTKPAMGAASDEKTDVHSVEASITPSGAAGGASADARDAARHDCVARINEMLAEHNTQLAEFITFGNATREPIALMTQKADAKKRGKTVNFFASFCPMCGVSLVKDSL